MTFSLIEWLGIGGFILGGANSFLLLNQHLANRPILTISKANYHKHKMFDDLTPVEYANKALKGDFNKGELNYEIRELIVTITNTGNKDAKLKDVLSAYLTSAGKFVPQIINFYPLTISGNDRIDLHLYFKIPLEKIQFIESKQSSIQITFDFVHSKIDKRFQI